MPQLSEERIYELENKELGRTTLEDHALAGGFLHYCPDWDYLLIDQTDIEFDACSCDFGDIIDPKTGKFRVDA